MYRIVGVLTAGLVACLAGRAPAASVTFDFESEPAEENVTSMLLVKDGLALTITRSGITFRVGQRIGFPPSWGTQALSPWDTQGSAYRPEPFILDFSTPITSATIDMGDFGEDQEVLTVEAYSGLGKTGALLDTDSRTLIPVGKQFDFFTLSVAANSIGSLAVVGGGQTYPNSVFYDNITVTPVPEPTSLASLGFSLLLGTGIVLAGRWRRIACALNSSSDVTEPT